MISRRNWLRAAMLSPVVPWRADADCDISPCGATTDFQITRQPGKRVALENLPNLNQLVAAYAAIQPGSGRMSLTDQRDIHKFYSGHNPATSDVHAGPPIFLWHRWFLYFHECLLSRMAQQPITLPYWDGSLDPALPLRKEFGSKPLLPDGQACQGTSIPAAQALTVLGQMAKAGDIQSAYDKIIPWHDEIHTLAPYTLSRPCLFQEMETAAGDPLFYVFHTQFDRIFDWWRALKKPTIEQNYLNQTFAFVYFPMDTSIQPSCVCVKAGDALNLQYTYDDPKPKPRKGSFRLLSSKLSQPLAAVEVEGLEPIPGVTQYRVTLDPGTAGTKPRDVGYLNILEHHTHMGRWPGRPVYAIPKDFDFSGKGKSMVFTPLKGNYPPIKLTKGFSIVERAPMI